MWGVGRTVKVADKVQLELDVACRRHRDSCRTPNIDMLLPASSTVVQKLTDSVPRITEGCGPGLHIQGLPSGLSRGRGRDGAFALMRSGSEEGSYFLRFINFCIAQL